MALVTSRRARESVHLVRKKRTSALRRKRRTHFPSTKTVKRLFACLNSRCLAKSTGVCQVNRLGERRIFLLLLFFSYGSCRVLVPCAEEVRRCGKAASAGCSGDPHRNQDFGPQMAFLSGQAITPWSDCRQEEMTCGINVDK